MVNHDKKLMIDELKKYFKKKYHAMISKLDTTDVQALWNILNGKA
jgi:hypothetical protein